MSKVRMTTVPRPKRRPTAKGRALGAAFAALQPSDFDRADLMFDAIMQGIRDANRRDEISAAIANDTDALRALGFHGVDRE